jgi:hypothetical protein
MTSSELRSLILSQPDSSPLRVAFAEQDFVRCSELMALPTQRGRVPSEELRIVSLENGLYGACSVAIKLGAISTEDERKFFGLCSTFMDIIKQPKSINIDNPAFQLGLSKFVVAGFLTTEQSEEINDMADNRAPLQLATPHEIQAAWRAE